MSQKSVIDFNKAKIKIQERGRGRMKISIKLSAEEAEGFKNFMQCKPEQITDDQFYKHVFFSGCKAINDELLRFMEENKAMLQSQKEANIQSDPDSDVEIQE